MWAFARGQSGIEPGIKISVSQTINDWRIRNGCFETPQVVALPDVSGDAISINRHTYQGCAEGGNLVLLEAIGGGHHWPSGSHSSQGNIPKDIDSTIVLDFFKNN